MARYTGPVFKKSRRYGFSILETNKEFAKGKQRRTPPGQHGGRRIKLSDYGQHLHEKQKLRYLYGLAEKQMKRLAKKATNAKGITGVILFQMLESRLDNFVYRAGFAATRRQARQLVVHNHFLLNGKKANIPSMAVSPKDVVTLKPKSHKNVQIEAAMASRAVAGWISRDNKKFTATLDRLPERRELTKEINEALIVEYYSK